MEDRFHLAAHPNNKTAAVFVVCAIPIAPRVQDNSCSAAARQPHLFCSISFYELELFYQGALYYYFRINIICVTKPV